MILEFVAKYNGTLILVSGVLCAAVGMIYRRGPSGRKSRDYLVFSDGFLGATVASLLVVAFCINHLEEPSAIVLLKEQANLIAIYSVLGSIQQIDWFGRSLRP